MDNTWILVANAAQARIYTGNVKLDDKLEVVKSLTHPQSRQKNVDLVADKGGNFSSSGHGTMSQDSDPKAMEEAKFAKEITSFIDSSHVNKQFDKLIIIAGPKLLGQLKKMLTSSVNGSFEGFIEKDYTQLGERELIQKVRENIYPFYS